MNQARLFCIQSLQNLVEKRILIVSFDETAQFHIRENIESDEISEQFEVKLLANLEKVFIGSETIPSLINIC